MKFCDEIIQKHLLNGGKIKRESCDFLMFLSDKGLLSYKSECQVHTCCIHKKDLISDDWEIVEPEYDWDKIVKDKILCHFWDNNQETQTPCMGYLEEKAADGFRRCGDGYATWKNCAPVKIEQFNIAKDLKEYEK